MVASCSLIRNTCCDSNARLPIGSRLDGSGLEVKDQYFEKAIQAVLTCTQKQAPLGYHGQQTLCRVSCPPAAAAHVGGCLFLGAETPCLPTPVAVLAKIC